MIAHGRCLVALITLIVVSATQANASNSSQSEKVEGRLQSYDAYFYRDVQYWWPWFTDLAAIIMIKLKIAIGLAAMYAFGDGYYWTKGKPAGHEAVSSDYLKEWAEPPACFSLKKFWGRRKRDLSGRSYGPGGDHLNYAEVFFDLFEIHNHHCRKLLVCEMGFDATGEAKASVYGSVRHDLFEEYRGAAPERKSDCRKIYNQCSLWSGVDANSDDNRIEERVKELTLEGS